MFVVYILQSEKTKRYYTGYTSDIDKRLHYHNTGKNKSTRTGMPWKLIKQEIFPDKKSAWLRERELKRYKGSQAFKRLANR